MRIHVYLLFVLGLLAACQKDSNEIIVSGGPGSIEMIEIDPSLTFDGRFVYYVEINLKTNSHTLYRMTTSDAKRTAVFAGSILGSPSANPNNSMVAFIATDNRIQYWNYSSNASSFSAINATFEAVLFINENRLVASRNDSLFIVDELNRTVEYLAPGRDPSFFGRNELMCVVRKPSSWQIVRYTYFEPPGSILATLTGVGEVRSPSYYETEPALIYTIGGDDNYSVQALLGLGAHRHLQTAIRQRALIVHTDLILYTGPDGRLYATDFEGSLSYPFLPEGDLEDPAKLTRSD